MRITNQMIANRTLHNLSGSLRRMDVHNQHLSTGKRIGIPSDDPAGVEVMMRLQTALLENEKYTGNVDEGISWLHSTDEALNQVTEAMHRARVLALNGANGSLPQDALDALANEVDQLLQDLIQVGNLRFGAKYMFAGANTLTKPFEPVYGADGKTIVEVQYTGTSEELPLQQEIGPGLRLAISVHGDLALKPAMDALIHLRDSLSAGNREALTEVDATDPTDPRSSLERIDDAIDNLLTWRSEAGARANRLELVKTRLQETHISMTRLLSDRTDVDIAGTIVELKMEETVYRAALASGARIIQPTLMDFLR